MRFIACLYRYEPAGVHPDLKEWRSSFGTICNFFSPYVEDLNKASVIYFQGKFFCPQRNL
ncbi:MAG TPA: hypothetical protein PK711_03750 [Bacteroidales bacterium]|nr:hypothetical protein [Bacteroidales bacterium]